MRSRSTNKGSGRKLTPLRGAGKKTFSGGKTSKSPLAKGWVDEEIESESDDSADERVDKRKGKAGSKVDIDEEDEDEEEELNETADQKRRRYN